MSDLQAIRTHIRAKAVLEAVGLAPGMPQYQNYRRHLAPIWVDIGSGTDEEVTPYWWMPGREANGTLLVTGASGSGKTEALKLIGTSIAEHGIPLVSIDFHGDLVMRGTTEVRLSSGPQGHVGINPLALDFNYVSRMGLRTKIEVEVSRIQRACGRMGPKQITLLKHALMHAYASHGIQEGDSRTWSFPPPSLATLEALLQDKEAMKQAGYDGATIDGCRIRINSLLSNAVFSHPAFIPVNDMLSHNVRFNCSTLSREAQVIVAETLLEMIL